LEKFLPLGFAVGISLTMRRRSGYSTQTPADPQSAPPLGFKRKDSVRLRPWEAAPQETKLLNVSRFVRLRGMVGLQRKKASA
jgi:hypothetical protein